VNHFKRTVKFKDKIKDKKPKKIQIKMKISWKIIIFVFIVHSIFGEEYQNSTESKDFLTFPKVLHDIAAKFLPNQNTEINIFMFESNLSVLEDIATDFMTTANETFAYRLRAFNDLHMYFVLLLRTTTFLFLDDIFMFEYIEKVFEVIHFHHQPIKHFAFIPYLTFDELNSSQIYDYYKRLPVMGSGVFVHAYFITNEIDTVTLSTVEWFSPYGCHRPILHKLNTFDKKTQKWTSKLENYDKFLNYHNCELVMALPVALDGLLYHMSGFAMPNMDYTDFDVLGISTVIFEIGAKHHNYMSAYQPVLMSRGFMTQLGNGVVKIFPINHTSKRPDVYFEMTSTMKTDRRLRVSKVLLNLNFYVFVTPGEKYTPYEKFILPFDLQTWILLFVTFLITFLTIMIINRLSKTTQTIVYGDNVATPIWNVLRIFFGISQTKLPNKKFSRFILMIFIFFCLIFRTCFQSKFFEFMTSEPRYPPPRTIDELRERNYDLCTMQSTLGLFFDENIPSKW